MCQISRTSVGKKRSNLHIQIAMKRQTQNVRSKGETQNRLLERETFQYVTSDPRKYSAVSTRNERQLVKKIDTLQVERHKSLAKLSTQIREVRVHRWKLREVDEDTNGVFKKKDGKFGTKAVFDHGKESRIGNARAVKNTRNISIGEGLVLRKARPVTCEEIASKTSALRFNGRLFKYDRTNGYTSTATQINRFYNGARPQVSTKRNVHGLNDDRGSRNYLKYKPCNRLSVQIKPTWRERLKSPLEIPRADSTKAGHVLNGAIDKREKNFVNRNQIGKINTRTDARPRSGYSTMAPEADPIKNGRQIHITTAATLPILVNDTSHRELGPTQFYEDSTAGYADGSTESDQEGEDREKATVESEDWAETLKSCRYLRKPRGYETPEMPIESIFQNE